MRRSYPLSPPIIRVNGCALGFRNGVPKHRGGQTTKILIYHVKEQKKKEPGCDTRTP
jgi:hypothetical protein